MSRNTSSDAVSEPNSERLPDRRTLFLFFCWLYIGLGASSVVIGLALLALPRYFLPPGGGRMVVTGIFLVFGVVRVALAVRKMQSLSRPGKP